MSREDDKDLLGNTEVEGVVIEDRTAEEVTGSAEVPSGPIVASASRDDSVRAVPEEDEGAYAGADEEDGAEEDSNSYQNLIERIEKIEEFREKITLEGD